ncbi:hypothetical protein V8E36_006508 [Tilletia maclaganii]
MDSPLTPSSGRRGPDGGDAQSSGANPFRPVGTSNRANSLPSSPLGGIMGRGPPGHMRESESPDPTSLFDPMELQKIFETMLKTVNSALPTQNQPWRPLNKKSLEIIKAGAEKGLKLIEEARERDPSLLLQVRPQEPTSSETAKLVAETAQMRTEIKVLREAVLEQRATYASAAQQPTLLQRMGPPPPTASIPRPAPAHPEARLPKVRQRTRVVLNTQALDKDHPAKASTQKTLLDKMSGPVQAAIGKKPLSVEILLSGDIAINLASQDAVESLWKANDSWITSAFPNRETNPRLRPWFCMVFLLAAGTARSSARS